MLKMRKPIFPVSELKTLVRLLFLCKDPKLHYVTNIGSQNIPIEEKTLVIAYGSDFVNTNFLNFSCDRREIAKEWADELLNMAYNLMALNASAITTLEKAHVKLILSVDKDGKIPVKNILKMFAQNREDKKRVERALESAGVACGKNDSTSPSAFPFEVFFNFYKHLTGRSEVEKIFDELCKCVGGGSKHKSYMTIEQLVTFLNQQQRDPRLNEILYPYVTHERARDIINQYEAHKGNAQKGHLSFEGFLRYLMSDDNAIVAAEKFGLSEDMNQSLSHYFINSSHNTYLTGHQLTGRSSVEMYRQCLLAGCRCIELDCWNGKTSEDEPIITHGYTVVREVNFKDVIDAIAESAFKTSDYPVILSFENHCSPRVQAKMATYCQKVFGDMLLSEPLSTHPVEIGQPLPSPNQLIRKIIIKNKKKHYHHRGNNVASGNGELKGAGSGSAASGTSAPAVTSDSKSESATTARLQKANSKDSQNEGSSGNINGGTEAAGATLAPNGDLDDTEFESESEDEYVAGQIDQKESADWETGTAGKESEAGAEMSALVNYIQPVHFHSFEVSEKRNRSYEISSFGETSAATLLKEYPVDFVNYNKRQLSRIYPKGTRVDSSNYMPQVFWNAGCQLVALNFQTLDLPMQLNLGIFEYNGRCGYLLKPDFMRRVDRKFDPFAESTVDGIIAGSLSVKIISGQFLSDKRVGTYVEVESYGLPADTVRKRKFKTKVVPANGINPVYDDEPFVFKKVVLPDLCVIRIVACEENGKVIGHRVLPLVGLRPGYRHIGLRNESGQLLTLPSLFVYITVKDYVPDKLSDIADALVNPIKYQSEKEKRELQLSTLTDDYDETSETSMSDEPKKAKSDISETPKPKTLRTDDSGDGSRTFPSDGSVSLTHPLLTDVSSSSDKEPKRKGSKKTPPLIRTDVPEPHRDPSANFEIPEHLLAVESLEKFKESDMVKKYFGNLEGRLQDLEKRHSKLETKKSDSLKREEEKFEKKLKGGCKRLRKKSNGTNIDVSSAIKQSDGPVTEPEKALKREHSRTMLTLYENNCKEVLEAQQYYHKQIYDAIEKCMQCSHAKQLKSLDDFHDSLKDDVKKKSSVQRAEEMVELKKNYRDKNERARVKREIEQRQITQAVAELQKLEDYFIAKRKEVERRQEEVRKMFESDKEKALEKLKLEYDENLIKWRKKCLPDDAPPCNAPDTQEEVTAL